MKQALWHVVLISFHGDTSLEERKMVWELYQSLAEDCGGEEAGIALFRVDWNLDLRKNAALYFFKRKIRLKIRDGFSIGIQTKRITLVSGSGENSGRGSLITHCVCRFHDVIVRSGRAEAGER